jgi:quinol monooxygenase YgiN
MSGRRRRNDGWDDGHLDAQDDRRDPWADSSVDEWSARDRDPGEEADWSSAPGGGRGTGAYPARGRTSSSAAGGTTATGYSPAPPPFSSSQAPNGRGAAVPGDRYGAGAGYGGQRERGTANGYGPAEYNGAEYNGAGYNGAGYQDSGYGRAGNGASRRDAEGYGAAPGGQRNGSGYGGNGRPGGSAYAPEFTPADYTDIDEDGPAATPRPYGRLSIYTLHEDKAGEFDRLAERAAEGVRAAEPDTLVYVIHVVPKAPMQRIIYEIYRDRAAFLTHERQPHIRRFAADCASCVLATNIIDLRLKYAKVAALGSLPDAPMPPQANRMPRAQETGAAGDRYQQAAAQQPATQYQPAQYQPTEHAATQYARPESQQPGVASFTPAKDQYSDLGQPTVGRAAYQSAAQYGGNGAAGYAAGNGQYDAANVHSGAAGYANGGSYSSVGSYQSSNGYSAGNGYSNGTSYSAANGYSNGGSYQNGAGYSNGNGYSAGSGYANGDGYQNGAGYSNGNGYSATSGHANGGSYQNGTGYDAAGGYSGDGSAQGSQQYTPRYRELTSGASPDGGEGGYPDDGGRQSYRPQPAEWAPRSPDQR